MSHVWAATLFDRRCCLRGGQACRLRYEGIDGHLFKQLARQAGECGVQTIVALTVKQAPLCRRRAMVQSTDI